MTFTNVDEYFKDLESTFEHDKQVLCARAMYKYIENFRVFRRENCQHTIKDLLLKDIENFKSMPEHPVIRFIIESIQKFLDENERISVPKLVKFSCKYRWAAEKEEEGEEEEEKMTEHQELMELIENCTDHLYDALDTIVGQLAELNERDAFIHIP